MNNLSSLRIKSFKMAKT